MGKLNAIGAAIAVVISSQAGAEAPQRRLAVLEFDAPREISPLVLGKLADEARSGALEGVRERGFVVMTRENMLALLSDMGKDRACAEEECEVETARTIGADFVVSGGLVGIRGRLFMTLKLHAVATGTLLATEGLEGGDELDLVRSLARVARDLVEKGLAHESLSARHTEAGESFGREIEFRVPAISISRERPEISQLNLEAEMRLEEALDADERTDGNASDKARAWCHLAELQDRNPYRSKAQEACERWRAFEQSALDILPRLDQDHATLRGYLALKRISTSQKLAAVLSFLEAYGSLGWTPQVRAAVQSKELLVKGIESNSIAVDESHGTKSLTETRSQLTFIQMPAGSFRTGCFDTSSPLRCPEESEKPSSPIHVPSFWMAKTPVTVDAYARCVGAGACTAPVRKSTRGDGGGRENHPVRVTWQQAGEFCKWVGGRLPTAIEWEYAAKSGEDVNFPWGNRIPDPALASFMPVQDTTPVGSYPAGSTKWGLLDMAGNVWEWTASDAGTRAQKILKGGSGGVSWNYLRNSFWIRNPPDSADGFRCAL